MTAPIAYLILKSLQFKCHFKRLHLSAPVKQKALFVHLYKEIFPDYEIMEEEDMLDEGVAVLYNSISELIARKKFRKELLRQGGLTETDRCVGLQLLSQDRAAGREMLLAYIQGRNGRDMSDSSNHAIYRELVKILKEVREGKQNKPQESGRKKWKMTVE